MFCKTCLILAIQNMSRNAYAQFPPHLDIFPPHAIPPYGGGKFPPPIWKCLDETLEAETKNSIPLNYCYKVN